MLSTFNVLQLCQLNLNKAAQKEILSFFVVLMLHYGIYCHGARPILLAFTLLTELRAPDGLACRVPRSPVKTQDSSEDGALLALLCSIHGIIHTLNSAATQNG